MLYDNVDQALRDSLIGRTVVDPIGIKGKIITAEHSFGKTGSEVAVRFDDGTYTLDIRFDAQTWFNMSKDKNVCQCAK